MVHFGIATIDPYKVFEKIKLSEKMRIADFGCGRTGHFVFPAAKIVGEKGIIYAVDIIKNILESIKSLAKSEGYDNVQIVWSDIEKVGKTPIPEKSLDACFFVNILFQIKDRGSTMKEAARLLKSAGQLAIIDWTKKLGALGPSAEARVLPEKLIDLASECNLQLKEQSAISDYHYLLIFEKI